MKDNNNKFTVPQAPKTYEVRYVEQQKPKLSPAARAKVVNNGSYVSSKTTDLVPSYGPCSTCSNKNLSFNLRIVLQNSWGGAKSDMVSNTDDAREAAADIIGKRGNWGGEFTTGGFRQKNRDDLASKINSVIRRHNSGEEINETVTKERYIW